MWNRGLWCISALLLILPVGCGPAVDPQVQVWRERFVSESPLPGEQPIPDVQKAIKAGELKETTKFVVRARINAGDFPPFGEGQASFLVTDATGHDGDENHNPHTCPFCKRDIASQMARVEFCDDSGKPVRVDTRELFGVREFDLVLVEGTGRFEEDSLVVKATKMFVKR